MVRPFRLEPPSLPETTVVRSRLREALTKRWDHRIVTVIAGPGFGKTILLADIVAEGARREGARDVWLSCEPADRSSAYLAAGLASALALPRGSGIPEICDAVWSQAPTEICLVLDDVHEITAGSSGALLLDELVAELPRNGHLVLAAREAVPVATARLAASGQLVRVEEDELLFDSEELRTLASHHGADRVSLESTGGWPALVELTAVAGADLVLDYLWEEVLALVGTDRARLLARFAVVGGGDDEIASAAAGRPTRVRNLVASVPLAQRSAQGDAVLHPLWGPVLRDLLTWPEIVEALCRAADVHRRRGRYAAAIDLLAEAEAWEEVLDLLREAGTGWRAPAAPDELARWCRLLPGHLRDAPAALLAAGVEWQGRAPLESIPFFEAAAKGFRAVDDVAGEMAALFQQGVLCWWARDVRALAPLDERVKELAAAGSSQGRALVSIGAASGAGISGDDEKVLGALAGIGDDLPGDWPALVRWLRAGAYLRRGHIARARAEIDGALRLERGLFATTLEATRLRLDWLEGKVDEVQTQMADITVNYTRTSALQNAVSSMLSHALQAATLGDLDLARSLVAEAEPLLGEALGVLVPRMHLATMAAIAIGEGDEARAQDLVRDDVIAALSGGPDASIWRQHAGYARILVPDPGLTWTEVGVSVGPGLQLAEALHASRQGDLGPVRSLRWPSSGVVRAHLPVRWVVELAAAGLASGNPPPEDLGSAIAPHLRSALRSIIAGNPPRPVSAAASQWLARLPAIPAYRLRISLLGPLELLRDGEGVMDPDIRRQRVRELLTYLVIHRRVRREVVAADLWPEFVDGGRNLRVTLSYLQRLLQPDRVDRDPPFFVRSDGIWLTLTGSDQLEVDVWDLDARLDEADAAERAGSPAVALDAYRALLPLWRGEPFGDVPYASWADVARTRVRSRFVAAAVRAGELLLATSEFPAAHDAARRAIAAEPTSELAFRLLIRSCLAGGDLQGAQRTLDECRAALAALDLQPERSTIELVKALRPQA